ncbi:MAG: ornithine cyclodeaminase family protein [Actinobacteria bacterium]|nr:ornithine cyclodeaminase family protein [Actinomycetota bacterium]
MWRSRTVATLRVLSDQDVRKCIDIKSTLTAVEKAYVAKSSGLAHLYPVIDEKLHNDKAEFDIKSGDWLEQEIIGAKLVNWFGDNSAKGLDTIVGLSMLFDSNTGYPLALINASYITSMRTGASGAIAAKYLAKPDAKVAVVIGTGNQALFQIAFLISALPTIQNIYIVNPRSFDKAQKFTAEVSQKLKMIMEDQIDPENKVWNRRVQAINFLASADIEKPGVHINCMGADSVGKQEIDEELFSGARVFTDDLSQSISLGECQTAVRKGILNSNQIIELGDVINGVYLGRESENQVTVFDGTGISLQDISVGKLALDVAIEKNLGQIVNL